MKLLIACPSHNRAHIIQKYILKWIDRVKYDWKIFVEPKQLKYYKQYVNRKDIVTTADGIYKAGQLNHISRYAIANCYDLVYIIDDDMWFQATGFKKAESAKVVNDNIDLVIEQFEKQPNLGIVSIGSYGQHKWSKEDKPFVSKNRLTTGSVIVRPELIQYPVDVTHYDDLYLQLMSLTNGYYTLVFNKIFQCTPDGCYSLQGGFQSFDRKQLSEDNFKVIQKYYPYVTEWVESKIDMLDIDISWYAKNFQERK